MHLHARKYSNISQRGWAHPLDFSPNMANLNNAYPLPPFFSWKQLPTAIALQLTRLKFTSYIYDYVAQKYHVMYAEVIGTRRAISETKAPKVVTSLNKGSNYII